MKKTILALRPLLAEEMDEVESHFNVIRLWEEKEPEATLMRYKNNIQGILSTYNSTGVRSSTIDALPNLEIIAQFGVGYDNIDIQAAARRNIAVTNTPDILTADTADTAMMLLLNIARRGVEGDVFIRVGRWQSGALPLGSCLTGKTVGIVGLGKIGSAIAHRCRAFGMNVVYYGRSKKDVDCKFYDDLKSMAKDSDFLVLACSGGPDTENIINLDILEALGPKGFLINIARGSVVNEEDLLIALQNRTIAGAGLDVYANEPNVPEEMLKMDQVVLLPHIGSATTETRSKMGKLVIDNLLAHFEGKPLLTPVHLS
ncbi:MAG: 2-hydroxyacid dehydrogenase [Alphaproteobacteria bacterium]|nr:2-hydroxyacid dehydrogenase [Alphaproteobacteria bacterium]